MSIAFPTDSRVYGVVRTAGAAGHTWIEITWGLENVPLRSGDRYSVTVTDPDGATIAEKDATAASYSTIEPNGSWCPPTCHNAQFE